MTTTDHKVIGKLYLITSFVFFLIGGLMALLIRAELAYPGLQVVNDELYNQLFTMHGTIMLLLFATPLFFGFANVIMPLQIGSPDVAFPRLNMFSYWLFLFGGLIAGVRLPDPAGRGRLRLVRLHAAVRRRPQPRASAATCGSWASGMAGLGTILGAVNFITTIICMRAPGMTMFRMPIFAWNILVTSAAGADRVPGPGRRAALARGRPPARGPRLRRRQRRRRSCGSTCSGSSATPRSTSSRCRSSASSPRSCRCSAASRSSATSAWSARRIGIAILSVAVWAHHMFVTGAVLTCRSSPA